MNEELKIIIKAVTEQARKELQKVRKELDEVEKSAEEAEKVTESIKSIGKGAAAAVAGVVALTTALANLGKSALEMQKAEAKLSAGFTSAGSNAAQAKKTYQELYRFLGDTDTAVEASNLLAQLTTDEKELAEWTTILQGVYATFPESIPINSLAEAANETAKVGKLTGVAADSLNWLGVSEDAVNAKLQSLNSTTEREAYLRQLLIGLYGQSAALYERNNASAIAYNESQYKLSSAMASTAKYTTPLLIALNNMAATVLQAVTPAISKLCAYLIVLVDWIATAATYIASFFGAFSNEGNTAVTQISNSFGSLQSNVSGATSGVGDLGDSFTDASKAAEKLKRQTMGFDELNVMTPKASSAAAGGAAGGAGGASIPNLGNLGLGDFTMPDLGLDKFKMDIEDAKGRIQALLVLVGLVGAGIAAWKIIDAITNPALNLAAAFKNIAGKVAIVAGAILLAKGYSDAWVNGVNWGSLTMVLGGLAAIIGGLYLSFGSLAASIGTVAGGVAMLVLGVKDFIANGATMQNTILIIGGAIAVAVGLATAGVSTLVSVIVGAVTAIGAFTAAILLEEPAIMTVQEAQEALTAAKQRAAEAEMGYVNAVDAAEASMKRLEEAEKAAGITGEELYKQVQNGTIDYADMTDAQREVYKAYLDNEQKQKDLKAATEELNAAKKAETIASYENQLALAKESGNYDNFKKSVVEAFENGELSAAEARDLIEKSMSEMSDASQQTFMKDLPNDLKEGLNPHKYESTGTKIKKWFSNLWTDIKKTFSDAATVVANAVSKAFSTAINWVLEKAIGIINGFINAINTAIGIINKIPGVNITKLKTLDVPKLAKGGIIDSATLAVVGEAGKEAVMPLENNTGWMDVLADRIAARSGAPSRIILNVDGKELGWASINGINNITKQTGTLQLALV